MKRQHSSRLPAIIFCLILSALLVYAQRYTMPLRSSGHRQDTSSSSQNSRNTAKPDKSRSGVPRQLDDFDIRATRQRLTHTTENQSGAFSKKNRSYLSASPFNLTRENPHAIISLNAIAGTPQRIYSTETALQAGGPENVEITARRFIQENRDLFRLSDDEISALRIVRRDTTQHNGATHLTFQQRANGLEIFQARLNAHFNSSGDLIATTGELFPETARAAHSTQPQIETAAAMKLAAGYADASIQESVSISRATDTVERAVVFNRTAEFSRDVNARLVWFPLSADKLALAWEFELWLADSPDVYLLMLDAERGSLLYRCNLTSYEFNPLRPHGLVFTGDSPRPNAPYVSDNPATVVRQDMGFHATPFNNAQIFAESDAHFDWWAGVNADSLISNNGDAHLDRDANNIADAPQLKTTDGNFSFPLNLAQPPTSADNQKSAQVNLFYWINRYHDILYAFGFTEAAGNFQTSNFNLGGAGGDAIQADAQDGSGTNNANFTTPPDGRSGRMQMYLWDTASPQLDGDFDQGVVLHELTHGLSNRLIGNGTGLNGFQARAMGEGWSDFFGLTLLRKESDPLDGAYAVGQYVRNNYQRGIRRFAYSTSPTIYPYTFASLPLSSSIHAGGEIWCVALWEMRARLIQQYGFQEGQRQSLQLVVDGMKLTPIEPTFLEARDAILLADRVNNNGANQCLLWQAFAKRGMGVSAFTSGSADNAPTAAFDIPPYCSGSGTVQLDRPGYVSGEMIGLTLNDGNAGSSPIVKLSSSATGDEEIVTVNAVSGFPGSFRAAIRISPGAALKGDGLLQASVEANDQIIAGYTDATPPVAGDAGSLTATATATMVREKIIFEDTVENGNQGWIGTGTWAISETGNAASRRAWTDSPAGQYANASDAALISPLLDFTGFSDITLTFSHRYDFENRYDFGLVEYSLDNGSTWTRAAAFTGTQATFTQMKLSLNGFSGKPQTRFRFRLLTDLAQTADGWWIDGIRLSARSANPSVVSPGTAPAPVISAITPAFAPPAGNVQVVLTGRNFTEAPDTAITFDGVPATNVSVQSSTTMTATVPAHAAGAVTVRVINRQGSTALSEGFTYFQTGSNPPAPQAEQIFPASGSLKGGTMVTLIGKNFSPDATVLFSSLPAAATFVNSRTLRVVTPAMNVATTVDVSITQGTNRSELKKAFQYVNPTPPLVQVLSPQSGETIFIGSTISIRWQSNDNRAITKHRLTLMRVSGQDSYPAAEIAAELSGETQAHNWVVPTALENGIRARIRVTAVDDEGAESAAFSSGEFTIARRWEAGASMPYASQRLATATDGRFIYAMGGRMASAATTTIESVSRFDPLNNTWMTTGIAPMPTGLSSSEAAFLDGMIYVPGGFAAMTGTLTTKHLAYSVAENQWKQMSDVPAATYSYALTADEMRRVIYLTGGSNSNGNAVASVRVYNPRTNAWSELPAMKTARYGHEAAIIDGRLFVIGGFGNTGGLVSGEVFDFTTQKWSDIAPLNRARRFAISALARDASGNLCWLMVGGDDPLTAQPVTAAELYDARLNRWITLDDSFHLLIPRTQLAGVFLNDRLYAIGGATLTAGGISTVASAALESLPLRSFMPQSNNLPPAVAVPAAQTAIVGQEISFPVRASSLNAQANLSLTAAALPDGASFTIINPGSSSTGSAQGLFRWTPRSEDRGKSFTLTFTVSDGSLNDSRSVMIRVAEASPLTLTNAASYQIRSLAPDAIVAAFGSNLAVQTEIARDLPLPTELAGTSVTVNGVRAPLFFVSPTQINFAVPSGTDIGASGEAVVIVTTPDNHFALGTLPLTSTHPALFTMDASGRGEAAALATRDGISYQQAPFDVSANGQANVLALFGTGFRHAAADHSKAADLCTVTIGGIPAKVMYVGAQGALVGLDQLNVELPQALATTGNGNPRAVEVIFSVNGIAANRVTISIR